MKLPSYPCTVLRLVSDVLALEPVTELESAIQSWKDWVLPLHYTGVFEVLSATG